VGDGRPLESSRGRVTTAEVLVGKPFRRAAPTRDRDKPKKIGGKLYFDQFVVCRL
jgi:hypothetical protein